MTTTLTLRRPRLSAAEKLEILRAYRERGVTQARFCRERGLAVSTLQYWLRERADRPAPRFIELKTPPLPVAGDWAAMVALPEGIGVKAAGNADPRWVAELVLALRCGA
jgi:transposase-like protein